MSCRRLCLLFALWVAGTAYAQERTLMVTEPRVALVIGNSGYKEAPLRNPVNDATDIAATLRSLGFAVTLHTNADTRQMRTAIREFAQTLKRGGVGLFYFAGHGVQSRSGRNYLIPVGADLKEEFELEDEAVDANRVLAGMEEAGNRVNIVILDACRNNPFARSWRSAASGLAQMGAPTGSFVAFATSPGSVAADGLGRNGTFTKHLLQNLQAGDPDIDRVFTRVTAGVARETGNKQVPWKSSSLTGDFLFALNAPSTTRIDAVVPTLPSDSRADDRALWESVKDSRDIGELQVYLDQFPKGMFAGVARARMKSLASTRPPEQLATAPTSTFTTQPLSMLAQEKINLSIATGGTGGVYYPLGGGMANVLSKAIPGMAATAEVTGGSVDNLKLIGTGQPYIAMTMTDAALDAYKGVDKFQGQKTDVRTLMILYPNRMHVVSIEGTGVNTMKDLKGKRVSTGLPGSATEVMALRVIEAAGLDKDADMRRERLGVADSVNAIKDRKIDAFFWMGGLPTAAVTDLAATPGVKIKMIDHADTVPAMNRKYGNLYVTDAIPKATYPGMTADNKQATAMNILVSNANLSDQTAYNIVKTVFDKRDDLIAVHREAMNFNLENQKAAASSVPWHPGAIRYFNEKGIKLQ